MKSVECPKCKTRFAPRRKDMRYCSHACAKNATRTKRTIEHKRRNNTHYDRAAVLLELLKSKPSREQTIIVADLLTRALEGDAALKNILTDPNLLNSAGKSRNIAQTVNKICLLGSRKRSIDILRQEDREAISKIARMVWLPDRCPKNRPAGWDYRHLLPMHLRPEKAQPSSAYNTRPEELSQSDTQKVDHSRTSSAYNITPEDHPKDSSPERDYEGLCNLRSGTLYYEESERRISFLEVLAA